MSNKIVPLSAQYHQALRLDKSKGFPHAAHLDTTLLFLDEVQNAVADYCILFNKDIRTGEFKLLALLGLGFGMNAFQNNMGWNATYVPQNISRYPFLLAQGEGNDAFILCIDEDAPQLSIKYGTALYDENGDPSPFQKQMSGRLHKMASFQQETQDFIKAISSAGLLKALTLDAKMQSGETHGIEGLYCVNKEALEHLDGETLEKLHAKKYLEPLILINGSTAQLPRLVQLHNGQQHNNLVKTLELRLSD